MYVFFFFNDTATTEIYTLSLHDALPILGQQLARPSLQDFRQRIFLKIRWVLKSNNGILFHGVSFLGLGQVVTSTITRIRRPQFIAVHKIRL